MYSCSDTPGGHNGGRNAGGWALVIDAALQFQAHGNKGAANDVAKAGNRECMSRPSGSESNVFLTLDDLRIGDKSGVHGSIPLVRHAVRVCIDREGRAWWLNLQSGWRLP
jgi:hypothetical protein